jgi:hypothetical protein
MKANKTKPPTKAEMKKAENDLKRLALIQGMDACHICGKKYADYEHSYHGVTLGGVAVAVCAECAAAGYLRYGFSFGIYHPTDENGYPADKKALEAAFYSHPWNKAGNVKGTH